MSNSVFQSVMIQLQEAADRVFGVVDVDGCVVSCTDTSFLGERWPEAVMKITGSAELTVTFGQKTFRAMMSSTGQLEYAVFCAGRDPQDRFGPTLTQERSIGTGHYTAISINNAENAVCRIL